MNGTKVADALYGLLNDKYKVTLWEGAPFSPSKPLVNSIISIADEVDLAIFVFPYQDICTFYLDEDKLRSNLLFEVGLFVGALGLDRIFLILPNQDSFELLTHPEKVPSPLEGLPTFFYDARKNEDLHVALSPVVSRIDSMISNLNPLRERKTEFYSCYISYSSRDQEFVKKLYDDLKNVGVRCWLDEKDMRIGVSLAGQISRASEIHDKVVLVLSESSIHSTWVETEISRACELEQSQNRTRLFPISIDNFGLYPQRNFPFNLISEKYIGDFRNWQDPNSYKRSFSRLVRDLAISTSVETGGKSNA